MKGRKLYYIVARCKLNLHSKRTVEVQMNLVSYLLFFYNFFPPRHIRFYSFPLWSTRSKVSAGRFWWLWCITWDISFLRSAAMNVQKVFSSVIIRRYAGNLDWAFSVLLLLSDVLRLLALDREVVCSRFDIEFFWLSQNNIVTVIKEVSCCWIKRKFS